MPSGPPAAALAAILGPSSQVVRRVDIYEEDATTPWLLDAPLVGGEVSVDSTRDERRHCDLTLGNADRALDNYPGGFWYDKVVKVFRGVRYPVAGGYSTGAYGTGVYGVVGDAGLWLPQIGEFIIDQIESQNFPHTVAVKGRDYTAKLLEDEFGQATTFVTGTLLEVIIRAIAVNGQIVKMTIPATGISLGKDFSFEAGTSRWKAMTDLAIAYGYELFFDANGYLVMREFRDPVLSPLSFTFGTGASGTLANYTKIANQTRLYNAVDVLGQASDRPPVFATAENQNPSSPTSIGRLRRRKVFRYTSPFIDTTAQAQDVANKFLAIHGLESYELTMGSIVLPWLEASDIVGFDDPAPNLGDPTRFLLSDFTIPLSLTPMSSRGRRVQVVT